MSIITACDPGLLVTNLRKEKKGKNHNFKMT